MATPSQVRAALVEVLGQVADLNVIPYPPETSPAALPALVIGEASALLAEADPRRGLDTWDIALVLLVGGADYQMALEELDELLVRSGPRSVRQCVADNCHLGLDVSTHARIDRVEEYGPRSSSDGQYLVGATLRLIVRCTSL